jgi:CheY-like chemotaxis protein
MSSPEKKVVLIVDDEPEIRKLVSAMVGKLGYTALTADSGDHALTVYRNQGPISLLITDVVSPGMSGPMLADKLIELQPGLRVLFISGYDQTHLVRKFVLDRGHALLPKPFTVTDLRQKLDLLLPEVPASA